MDLFCWPGAFLGVVPFSLGQNAALFVVIKNELSDWALPGDPELGPPSLAPPAVYRSGPNFFLIFSFFLFLILFIIFFYPAPADPIRSAVAGMFQCRLRFHSIVTGLRRFDFGFYRL